MSRLKQLLVLLVTVCLMCSGTVRSTFAVVVDFESLVSAEGDPVSNEIQGITFTNAILALPGIPQVAFSNDIAPKDTITGSGASEFTGQYITDPLVEGDFGIPDTITIEFHWLADNVSFWIGDIDADEVLTTRAFGQDGSLIETILVEAGAPGTGDSEATLISFSSAGIRRIESIVQIPHPGNGRGGWGIDKITYSIIPSADFDEDGDVDGFDFLTWQRGFGTDAGAGNMAPLADGNANGDQYINGVDLAIWQDQYGTSGAPLSAAAAVIPEPSCLALVLSYLLCCSLRERRDSSSGR